MRRPAIAVLPIALAFFAPVSAPAQAALDLPPNVEEVASHGGMTQYRLRSNGMTLLLRPDATAPVFSFMVVYHVGSRNEAPGNTGSAHLLEHLLFNKSTANFGKANGHRTFQEVLFAAGADYASTNMTTWNDRMTGYSTLPSGELELAMRIEADRLRRGLLLDSERSTEMTVVRNEFEIGENDPATALYKAVVSTAIAAHPYHWDTIGYRADIEGVSTEELRRHYETYFWPDNADAILVGDVDPAAALRLFDREFGAFPRAPRPIPQVVTEEPPQEGERRVTVKRPGSVGLVQIGYLRPGALHPDFVPLDVLATLLGRGVSSRLHQALVETGLASNVGSENVTFRDPFPFFVVATVAAEKTHQEVEAALRATLERVAREGVSEDEVARARRQLEVAVVRGRDGAYPLTSGLGEAIASADWRWFVDYTDKVAAVTAADVQRVAATYLVPDRATVGWFVPVEPDAAPAALPAALAVAESFPAPRTGAPTEAATVDAPPRAVPATPAPAASASAAPAAPRSTFASRTLHRVLPNGIVLDVLESRAVPTVAIQGILLAGDATTPKDQPALAELTARMVQRGTATRSKLDIAHQLDGAGAELALVGGATEVTIAGGGMARDTALLLELLADQLLHPAFPEAELDKARREMRNDVLQQAQNTNLRAVWKLSQLTLPADHPYRAPEPEARIASLDALTVADLRRFHAERYVGAGLVLAVVGDVDAEAVAAQVEKLFAPLPRGERPPRRATVASAGEPRRELVAMPGKANLNLGLGQATGLRRTDPDYEAALLANAAFGQSSLASRLGIRVRDTEGLSYSLGSRLTFTDLEDGLWLIYVNLAPANLDQALASTRDELARYVREGITAEELRVQQSFFAGNYQVRLGSNAGIATALATAEKFGFGPGYLDTFPTRVRNVTLDEVNTALRRRIQPAKLALVVAGDLAKLPDEPAAGPPAAKP